MKKQMALVCAILALALCTSALAEDVPRPGAISVRRQVVDGRASFMPDSYPEVWITPVFDDDIIAKTDPVLFPARFIAFSAPEGGCMTKYAFDESDFLDHGAQVSYYYFAYDRMSFDLFLENARPENVLKDGSDGTALFTEPDSERARALIDLKDTFGGKAKMEVIVANAAGGLSSGQLADQIQAEVARVRAEMRIEELDRFWSQGLFTTVEIAADCDPYSAVVDVGGRIVTRIENNKVVTKRSDGRGAQGIEIAIDSYSYPHSQMQAKDAKLADGTDYLCFNTDRTGYASFTLAEDGADGPVYLTFKIDCGTDAFPAELEVAYARVQMTQAG